MSILRGIALASLCLAVSVQSQIPNIRLRRVVDPEHIRAHVMRPAHVATARSEAGRTARDQILVRQLSGVAYFDVHGFETDLHNALKDSVAGYVMQLRQNGHPVSTLQWQWAQTPADASEGWNANRQMHVASVSKLITGMAMTKLLDEHNISPDAKIVNYLPAYWSKGPGVKTITFRNLLTQTSGFNTTSSASDYQFMKDTVAAGAPTVGTYNYLNMNYGLCRILLSVINGNISKDQQFPQVSSNLRDAAWDYVTIHAYEEYVNDHVFAPAGVHDASLDHPAADALAYNFPVSGKGWNSGDLTTMAGGAGWHLSAAELLEVMGAFRRQGSIVPPDKAQAAMDASFGLDVVQSTPLGTLYNKNGLWWDGSHVEQALAYFLPRNMELVVLANSPVGTDSKFFRSVVTDVYLKNIKTRSRVNTPVVPH